MLIKKRGKYGREDRAGLGVGLDGEGWPGTHIAKDKFFDLNFSYIMGKVANCINFLTEKSKVNFKIKLL